MTIGGIIESYTHSNQNQVRENRIVKLETLLDKYKHQSRDDFNGNAYVQKETLKLTNEKRLNPIFEKEGGGREKDDVGL